MRATISKSLPAFIIINIFQYSTESTLILIPWTDFNIIEREARKCLDKS